MCGFVCVYVCMRVCVCACAFACTHTHGRKSSGKKIHLITSPQDSNEYNLLKKRTINIFVNARHESGERGAFEPRPSAVWIRGRRVCCANECPNSARRHRGRVFAGGSSSYGEDLGVARGVWARGDAEGRRLEVVGGDRCMGNGGWRRREFGGIAWACWESPRRVGVGGRTAEYGRVRRALGKRYRPT